MNHMVFENDENARVWISQQEANRLADAHEEEIEEAQGYYEEALDAYGN